MPETFARLARIGVVPDRDERIADIRREPERLAFFQAIRQAVGEGRDPVRGTTCSRPTTAA